MATLVEIVRNYCKPPEVEELFKEYARFQGTLIPFNQYPMPKSVQRCIGRMYELGRIPQSRIIRVVEDLPRLEQKIEELKTKYLVQIGQGLAAAMVSIIAFVGVISLGPWNPYSLSRTMSEKSLLYAAGAVGLLSLVHIIHSGSTLANVNDVKYHVDTVLKQALSTSEKMPGIN